MSTYSRQRRNNCLLPCDALRYNDYYLDGRPSATGVAFDTEVGSIGSDTVTDDVETPNFKARKRHGEIILNPFNLSRSTREKTDGFLLKGPHPTWGKVEFYGDFCHKLENAPGVIGLDTSLLHNDLPRMRDIAVISAHAKLNASGLMVGEIFSDLEKTLGMLRRPFKGCIELLHQTIKATRLYYNPRRKSLKLLARAHANAWLERRYGWVPLIGDISTLMLQVEESRRQSLTRRRVVRSLVKGEYKRTQAVTRAIGGQLSLNLDGEVRDVHSARVAAGIIYDLPEEEDRRDMARILGTRSRDLLPTLYEIVPYSFVADWFVNVGDWLQAMCPDPLITIRGSWVTSVINSDRKVSGIVSSTVTYPPVTTYKAPCGTSHLTSVVVNREANPSVPLTPVRLGKPLSVLQTIDALSLSVNHILNLLKFLKH